MNTSLPRLRSTAGRVIASNWKGFIVGMLTLGIPIAATVYFQQRDRWDQVDQSVAVLVNTVIDLDSVLPALQPSVGLPRSARIKFVREFQSNNHPSEWILFSRQIPPVSEDSNLSRYEQAIEGHRFVGRRAHGPELFAKAELRQRTDFIENNFEGDAVEVPISLLAFVETASFDRLVPSSESDDRIKLLLVSDRMLREFEGTPRIDLLDPSVRAFLKRAGLETSTFSETTAVPALTQIDDSAYRVQTPALPDWE